MIAHHTRDPRVDAYLEKAPDFARPILAHLREVMHSADPDISEGIKWGVPAFLWNGQQVANMAAFKAHAAFNFWRREVAGEPRVEQDAMGQFGRLTKISDLPSDDRIIAMARDAIALLQAGARVPRLPKHSKPQIAMPQDFAEALATTPGARAIYDAFPPGAQREYLEWIVDARQPATRARRIAQATAQLADGKRLNWKYQNC